MKEFCEEVLRFLEEEYGDGYGFCITLQHTCEWMDALLTVKYNNSYTLKVCSDKMNYLYRMYRSKEYIEERGQYLWQKELVDMIEGS